MIQVKLDFSQSVANEETAQEPATKARQSNSLIKANTLKNTDLKVILINPTLVWNLRHVHLTLIPNEAQWLGPNLRH